jgi:hypothetical protein
VATRRTTTERNLGHKHQQQVKKLHRDHIDGTKCWWCGRPMYRDKHLNWDRKTLAGDHSIPRARGGTLADRLLHGQCNSERGDGSHDDKRPALTGKNLDNDRGLGPLAMPWP